MLTALLVSTFVISVSGIAPVSWHPIFRQTLPGIWKKGQLSLNPDDDGADMFAVLDKIEKYKLKGGGYNLKLRWADPDSSETMHWKQTSNPFVNRSSGVVGYEAVHCPHTDNGWAGLQYDVDKHCLMEGSIGIKVSWFYCVGYAGADWSQPRLSFPAFDRPAMAVELFAMDPKTKKWVIVFRQTIPHLISLDTWSYNKGDPYNETYSILDELENFRNPKDGKLELKMNWPDRYNSWHQDSNPVTAPASTGLNVSGYVPINISFVGANWGGLEPNTQNTKNTSVLDGSIGIDTWFYAIGYQGIDWGAKTIPAYNDGVHYIGANQAELFAQVE